MAEDQIQRNQRYFKLLKSLEDDRLYIYSVWREISDYIYPSRGLFVAEGEKFTDKTNIYAKILNAAATRALNLLGAGMQGGLTSPSREWMRLVPEDEDLMKFEPVAAWLEHFTKLMYGVFRRSNFYAIQEQSYIDQAAFGNSVEFLEEDFKDVVRFYSSAIGTYCLSSDDTGRIETFVERTWMKAIDLIKKFGEENVSDQVKNCKENNPYKQFQIVHFVLPREERNIIFLDNRNMPYESIYLEYKRSDTVLREKGYREKPFTASRWSENDPEIYGRSPGHLALGITKLLQSHEAGSTKAMHKEVDPPMRIPISFTDTLDMLPGGENRVASNNTKDAIGKLFDMTFDYAGIENKIVRIEGTIERIFFNDLFFTVLTGKEMTATEVLQRHEEQLMMLGPVIEHQMKENLDPKIDRTAQIMFRRRMVPPPPRELINQGLKIDYVSLLAQAQKMIGTSNIRSYANDALQIGERVPETLIKTNWEQLLDELAIRVGVPAQITRSEDEANAIRQKLADQAEAQRQQELLANAADDIKKLSQAKTDEKSVLTDLAEAAGER